MLAAVELAADQVAAAEGRLHAAMRAARLTGASIGEVALASKISTAGVSRRLSGRVEPGMKKVGPGHYLTTDGYEVVHTSPKKWSLICPDGKRPTTTHTSRDEALAARPRANGDEAAR